LSINVRLPGSIDDGPYPTVVEYSGYNPSDPSEEAPASRLARALGYATVGVNLRGTGCSGGAWSFLDPAQARDGYDVVETIAAQPWVAHGKVGMVGISYSGIMQLGVAELRPPRLAAITPLSVIDETRSVTHPGGIPNVGFARDWATDRAREAQPSGEEWVRARIADGDRRCRRNQKAHRRAPDVASVLGSLEFGATRRARTLAPGRRVGRIAVPVFLAGTWQDEETGSYFAEMLDDFDDAVPSKFTLMNGVHADPLGPAVVTRWAEFLDFYVARRVPHIPFVARLTAPFQFDDLYGKRVGLPDDRFDDDMPFATALAAYEREPRVRVLFDSGAGDPTGVPLPGFEVSFSSWPPPATAAAAWYFGPDGSLAADRPDAAGADEWIYDPAAFPATSRPRRKLVDADPGYRWKPPPAGRSVRYTTAPLGDDVVVLGAGSVDLWLRSTARDVDLEVTVTEVRPDGRETYVQSGWLRASQRALDRDRSDRLDAVPTFAEADSAPLPRERAALVRVPVYPFGHAFRAGSRVRITVQAPGGNRPKWAFGARTYERRVLNTIVRSTRHPSRVVLPVVSGVDVPTPLPACDILRGQPCRNAEPKVMVAPGTT
jgi:predicted acyl esterase